MRSQHSRCIRLRFHRCRCLCSGLHRSLRTKDVRPFCRRNRLFEGAGVGVGAGVFDELSLLLTEALALWLLLTELLLLAEALADLLALSLAETLVLVEPDALRLALVDADAL